MTHEIPPARDLMPLLLFDEADLDANRRGQLGEGQQQRLQRLQRRTLLIGVLGFWVFALVAAGLLTAGQAGTPILTVLGILTTMLNAIFIGIFGRQWMRLRADVQSGTVQTLSGTLERVIRANGRMNNFVLRIEDEDLYVQKELFKLFRHEVDYHVYRAPRSRVLLAAEPQPHAVT